MDATVGFVLDPEEMVFGVTSDDNQINSVQVEVSRGRDGASCLEVVTSLEMSEFERSQPLFSQHSATEEMNTEYSDEGISDLLTEQNSMPLRLSWEPTPMSSEPSPKCSENPIQPTLDFYSVEATQTWTFSQRRTSIEVLPPGSTPNLQTQDYSEIDTKPAISQSTTPMYQELSPIPASIRDLYSSVTEQYSDYCFSYMLAAQLCQDTVPMNSYNSLKLGLLLSITSIHQSPEDAKAFHVISLGADTAISHLLMTSIGQLARRFVTGMLDPLAGGRVLEDNFVECGATTLARTGVCYIGDWSMQKVSNSTRILREIESGQVIIENHAISYPLECAIWTSWNYTRRAKQDISSMVTFLNTFGIPIVLPEETTSSVIDFILEKSLVNAPAEQEALISEDDVRQFLAMLYYQQVSISADAEKLLSEYFVVTRLNTPEFLTQASLSALRKLTEAHARLCFRNVASRLDAVVAIIICERFIHTVFANVGNAAPLAESFEGIDDLEQHLYRFDCWLKVFLRNSNHH
ncbi:minichromosome maintenance domain-containing protein 2 [Topomyia yanbarensis]|uniref:minichromosome maintenance domain-containing protein 2 n=1 Tax=Topomyia yanbarensis TaxID=2498891 RepID=UPI00273B0C77|nr:minichromosome maintenance domain-containing protein 2 [Topomyia yanbarensis]